MSKAKRQGRLLWRLFGAREFVTGADLAEGAGVALRTVYRDVAEVQLAGVPIVGGPGKGYRLVNEARVSPVLTLGDVIAIAEALGDRIAGQGSTPAAVQDALDRLLEALPAPMAQAVMLEVKP